jgi:hypothetical protein
VSTGVTIVKMYTVLIHGFLISLKHSFLSIVPITYTLKPSLFANSSIYAFNKCLKISDYISQKIVLYIEK